MNNAIAWLFAIPFGILWHHYGFIPALLISLLIFIGIFAVLRKIHNEKVGNQANSLRTCIEQHLPELLLKHRQLTFVGDYGTVDALKWQKEKKKFIDLVFVPRLGGKTSLAISDTYIHEIIDRAVEIAADNLGPSRRIEKDASGQDYEVFCATLLEDEGWQARLTSHSGDQGADIIANKSGIKLVVQCKYYTGQVGNDAVQQVAAARTFYEADIAVVMSNARYTRSARQLAKSLGVQLLHHDEVTMIGA